MLVGREIGTEMRSEYRVSDVLVGREIAEAT